VDDFEAELMRELRAGRELPEGTMAVKIPVVRTTAGEIRISNQLLYDRFAYRPPRARLVRARFWLRVRAIRSRGRIAEWIAPWLRDDADY